MPNPSPKHSLLNTVTSTPVPRGQCLPPLTVALAVRVCSIHVYSVLVSGTRFLLARLKTMQEVSDCIVEIKERGWEDFYVSMNLYFKVIINI